MNNFAKLVLDITDECSLTSADHFDACSKQAYRGLCNRELILHSVDCIKYFAWIHYNIRLWAVDLFGMGKQI